MSDCKPIDTHVPLATALDACAGELRALTDQCDRLQGLISPLLRRVQDAEEIQALDLLTQSLAGVAQYLAALSDEASPDWRVDSALAASVVTLDGLASRLRGHAADQPETASGDLDFFS